MIGNTKEFTGSIEKVKKILNGEENIILDSDVPVGYNNYARVKYCDKKSWGESYDSRN